MRIMIIGATSNREKYGNKAVRAYIQQGHEVLPVNPSATEVEGVRCYSSIADVPGVNDGQGKIDRATLYIPAKFAIAAVRELGARGDVVEVFFNPGTESDEAMKLAEELGMTATYGCAILDVGVNPHAM